MASGIAFESSRVKEIKRQEKRDAQQKLLSQAKKQHDKEQYKKEQAKIRGEDTWMLPALSERIDREHKELHKKSKKEKKKKKKHKKEKKKKKQKSENSSSDDDDSGESEPEPMWVEKTEDKSKVPEQSLIRGPILQRDSWMEAPLDLIPTTSRQEIRDKEKEKADKETKPPEQMGQHERELNPYWKDGGIGLPEESVKKPKNALAALNIGDGGYSWMKKAYNRCVEQAKEENRTLEDVATEKYGSLKKLEAMLADAEKAYFKLQGNKSGESYRNGSHGNRGNTNDSGRSRMFMKPTDDDHKPRIGRDRYVNKRSRSRERYKQSRSRSKSPNRKGRNRRSRSNDKNRCSSSRDRGRSNRSRSRSRDRRRYSRSRSRDRNRNHRSRSTERKRRRSRSRSSEKQSKQSRSDSKGQDDGQNLSVRSSALKSRFVKPGEMSSDTGYMDRGHVSRDIEYVDRGHVSRGKDSVPAWKKKEFIKPKEETKDTGDEYTRSHQHSERKRRKSASESSDSSASSQSESSDSESDREDDHHDAQDDKEEEVVILSEQEMNQLGAKIVRAEIMGDNELAESLKKQLEKARENNEKYKQDAAVATGGASKESDNVVVLTRMDKKGMVRPLPEGRQDREKGKKRKKAKVTTHSGAGERQRYFDDDDKFDLKQLVEREKMGTAEDQNMMFARLAGRSAEKTDDDFQVDDIFISKASAKQSDAKMEERDRAQAIFEHKKMATALEKCQFCFENVPKHLIIAIGMKVYLCLPNHRSLVDGHCLIVPMQHVAAGTAVDEDVWSEIQVFRKGITKMFETMDQDVVFMETSMGLRHHPHMNIECIPLPKETGDLAPIYFKKAILESDTEWSQNKKLVDLSKKDVRRSIPKGFPYFAVDFGLQGGFAHAIEDERKFPNYFGKEIVGGMIDAEPRLWRKPQRENFDDQGKKVLEFAEWWKPYDWTQKLQHVDS